MIWKLHNRGVLESGQVVAPDERLGWGRTIGLGAQHVVAMFGATFVFPVLMGLNPHDVGCGNPGVYLRHSA